MFPGGIGIFQALQISVESLKTAAEAALLNFSRRLPLTTLLHQFQKHPEEETGVGRVYLLHADITKYPISWTLS